MIYIQVQMMIYIQEYAGLLISCFIIG